MPNRVIKESIKRSDQIDSLSWFEEVLFYRLMVTADDYGCIDGRVLLIKNELFPLKENVTKKAVEEALEKLVSVGLLCKYTVSGMPYMFFPTWEKHQRVRNKVRKFPAPPQDVLFLVDCGQLTADCCQTSADCPIESESESESYTPFSPPTGEANAFEVFWKAYPRKEGIDAARRAFEKIKDVPVEVMVAAINEQKKTAQWKEDNGKYIPSPKKWLSEGHWKNTTAAAKTYGDLMRDRMRWSKCES